MKKSIGLVYAGAILLAACSVPKQTQQGISLANGGKVWASLWQQRAAEYKALCFQAYNLAKLRLDEALAKSTGNGKPTAVVTDIDETLLDNSPYDAMRALNNQEYTLDTWKAWTAKAEADTVPGAPAFFKYAASKGVQVYYITNRDESEREGTTKNLEKYGLPYTDAAHIFLKNGPSSKEARRQQVAAKCDIVLLCGDNLPDFDKAYDDKRPEAERTAATERLRNEFGSRYIVIPNPSYGDFESALFKYNYKLSGAQKDSVVKANIKLDEQ